MKTEDESRRNKQDPETKVKKPTSNQGEIQLRPMASSGWWLAYLLTIAYAINCWHHQRSVTFEYKFSTIVAFGLLLQTQCIHLGQRFSHRTLNIVLYFIAPASTSLLIFLCLQQGVICCVFSGFVTTITYRSLFHYILRKMPKSFTYGEASIVIQGFMLFLTNLFFKLLAILQKSTNCMDSLDSMSCELYRYKASLWISTGNSEMKELSTILQIGLLGVTLIIVACYFIRYFRGWAFYILISAITVPVISFPIDDRPAISILIEFITKDLQKLCMITLYVGLIGLTVATVHWQMNRNEQSNTRTRKIFHILIVFVFLPGLIYQCTFLFVASGIALALLIVLETMRIIQLSPVHQILKEVVKSFIDEKDAGAVALTPIYLLVGCSLPLWIHPCPCDLTDSAGFELIPLLSGVISVGIGDTAASIVGSKVGRLNWPNGCNKTVEGTIAGILCQAALLPILIYFGLAQYNTVLVVRYLVAITVNSLVETFTDQVDNLVLPFVTYILLSLK